MFRKKLALLLLPIVIGVGLGVFLFVKNVQAGTSADGKFTVTPKVIATDNLAGGVGTQWVFTVTTTAELVSGDVVRFVLPSTTVGSPFLIASPTATAMFGISLFRY